MKIMSASSKRTKIQRNINITFKGWKRPSEASNYFDNIKPLKQTDITPTELVIVK